jgi:DNA polymerase-3 subunit epsilon
MIKFELKRPLVALDLETTSADPKTGRIVEMALIKIGVGPEGNITKTSSRFNPGIPIPTEASDVHGITDDMVAGEPMFKDKAEKLLNFIKDCDILGYNSNRFDIPLLFEEFARCGLSWNLDGINFLDSFKIFQIYEKRDLAAAVLHYTGKPLEGAHGALADIEATMEVFMEQLKRHTDLPDSIEGLNLVCNNDKIRLDLYGKFAIDAAGDYIYTFGKHKDKKCKDVLKEDAGYTTWMMNADFSTDTKAWCKKIHDSLTATPTATTTTA